MFPFPGYHPRNYQPGQQPAPPPPVITDRLRLAAVEAGAEFIHKDGLTVWRWRYDKLQTAFWDGAGRFGSWFEFEGEVLPAGELVEL